MKEYVRAIEPALMPERRSNAALAARCWAVQLAGKIGF